MAEYVQEMPPPGGFSSVNYKRIPLKPTKIYRKFGIIGALMALGWTGYHIGRRIDCYESIEMRCAKVALIPLLLAESDRAILKQFKKNRDAEERIMKDVEGWEVGKFRNQPVYLTLGPNEWFFPSSYEYFAHTSPNDLKPLRWFILETR